MEIFSECPKSGIPLNYGDCDGTKCGECGWNPEIARSRKKRLYRYTEAGRLRQWGKPEGDQWEEEQRKKLLAAWG